MNRIRELREAARMSVDELAAAVGTSDTQIRRLEAGTRRLTQGWMERIALALECSPADIIVQAFVDAAGDEVELADLAVTGVSEAIALKGLRVYRTIGTSVENVGIHPGDIITVDESQDAIAGVNNADVVIAQMSDPPVLVLRQFLRPDLLVTNRVGRNTAISVGDRSAAVTVRGVVIRN